MTAPPKPPAPRDQPPGGRQGPGAFRQRPHALRPGGAHRPQPGPGRGLEPAVINNLTAGLVEGLGGPAASAGRWPGLHGPGLFLGAGKGAAAPAGARVRPATSCTTPSRRPGAPPAAGCQQKVQGRQEGPLRAVRRTERPGRRAACRSSWPSGPSCSKEPTWPTCARGSRKRAASPAAHRRSA